MGLGPAMGLLNCAFMLETALEPVTAVYVDCCLYLSLIRFLMQIWAITHNRKIKKKMPDVTPNITKGSISKENTRRAKGKFFEDIEYD